MVVSLAADVEIIPGYKLTSYLGRGGFGEVWEALAPGGLKKAVKVAPIERDETALNCRELEGLQKMRSIRHPYLLSIERFEVIEGYLIIVMELADKSLLDRFDECVATGKVGIPRDELLRYMKEAAEVLDVMNNEHGLQHLDVKPANLFLSSGHVKVADFGLVQPRNSSMSLSAVAISPPYAAPELFDGRVEPTADLYSLAVTYQELLSGTRPYKGHDVRSLIVQHVKSKPEVSDLPAADRVVMLRALSRDTSQRPATCTEFVTALEKAAIPGPQAGVGKMSKVGPTHPAEPASEPAEKENGKPAIKREAGKQLFVPKKEDKKDKSPQQRGLTIAEERAAELLAKDAKQVQATFVAFLPLEIFGRKLKGFIDAMAAEIISCSDESAVLWLGVRGFWGKPKEGVFMDIGTCCPNPHSGHRVVDIMVRGVGDNLAASEVTRRGVLLIRYLKAHLMVSDGATPLLKPESAMRKDVMGK